MQTDFRPITDREYATWFEQNEAGLHGRSPFHHPAWLKASSAGVGFHDVYIGLFEHNRLVGAVPGYLTRRGPFRLFGSPMRGTMTSYLGPIGLTLDCPTREIVDLLMDCTAFVRSEWRVQYARFTLRNTPEEGKLPLEPDWQQQRSGSYRLDLTPGTEAVWKGLKSDCRRNIRKARKAGIEIVPLGNPALYFEMLDETFRRHSTTSFHSERFFAELLDGLVPADRLWPWSARYKGQEIAVGLFLHDDQEVHFISGASLPEFGNLPTSYLLHWHAIETGIAHGLRVFNSDASRVRSIDRFKESFRPTLEKRYSLTWAPALLYSAQKKAIAGYRQLRKFHARLKSVRSPVRSEA